MENQPGTKRRLCSKSEDKIFQITTEFEEYVYTSKDGGETWIPHLTLGRRNWCQASISDDGKYIAVAALNDSLFVSTDAGATWSECESIGKRDWFALIMGNDGKHVIIADNKERVYLSKDAGQHWHWLKEIKKGWRKLAIPQDISFIAVTCRNGKHVFSDNYGATWRETDSLITKI